MVNTVGPSHANWLNDGFVGISKWEDAAKMTMRLVNNPTGPKQVTAHAMQIVLMACTSLAFRATHMCAHTLTHKYAYTYTHMHAYTYATQHPSMPDKTLTWLAALLHGVRSACWPHRTMHAVQHMLYWASPMLDMKGINPRQIACHQHSLSSLLCRDCLTYGSCWKQLI